MTRCRKSLIDTVWGVALLMLVVGSSGCASKSTTREPIEPLNDVEYDKSVFQALLDNHAKIRREVTELPNGIRATTESDDPVIAEHLRDHVRSMDKRIKSVGAGEGGRVRQWDPIFVAVFDNASKIKLLMTPTEKGVVVEETSEDPRVVAIIKSHAGVVSGFAANGREEAGREHPVPPLASPGAEGSR
jgi:hypothetical protein